MKLIVNKLLVMVFVCLYMYTLPNSLQAQVVINEVTADPGNYDSQGAEWTELYNKSASAEDVSCWVLTNGESIITMPAGTVIPANGFLLIYNSNFFNCATCNWDASINSILSTGNVVAIDLANCDCTNKSAASGYAVAWNNSPGSGQDRIILFTTSGTIVDAVYYGSGANYAQADQPIPESVYAPKSELTKIGMCAYPNDISFDIPAITGNPIWENMGPLVTGCTTSFSRSTDGGDTWVTDNFPSPALTNTTPNFASRVNDVPVSMQELTDAQDTLYVCLGSSSTTKIEFDIYGYNKSYQSNTGDMNNAEGGSAKGGSSISATGGLTLNNESWTSQTIQNGISTLTYTSPAITSSTDFTFRIKENTQSKPNPNASGIAGAGNTINGTGVGTECYIEKVLHVMVVSPITAATISCSNGRVTTSTTPSNNVGPVVYNLLNSANAVLESNNTGIFQVGTSSTAAKVEVVQQSNCTPPIIATGSICQAAPACPNPNGETINGGTATVTACPGSTVTLTVNDNTSVNLPVAGTIDWYSGSTSAFDPYNNEGNLIGQSAINMAAPIPTAKSCGSNGLSKGDIVFIDYQGNYGASATLKERFSFVVLNPISAGTNITITDNGIDGTTLRTTEGAMVVNFSGATTPVGTIVTITLDGTAGNTNTVTISPSVSGLTIVSTNKTGSPGVITLSNSGDNLIAYCADNPITYLAVISSGAYRTTGATSSNDTYLPTGFVENTDAISLGDLRRNGVFACTGGSTSGTRTQLLASINNLANWTVTTTNTAPQTLPTCTYNFPVTVTPLSHSIPDSYCNQTNFIKGIVRPIDASCNKTEATTQTFQVNVTCPTASINGQSAICSGASTSFAVQLTSYGSSSTANVTYNINGGANITAMSLPISSTGTVTVPDINSSSNGMAANGGIIKLVRVELDASGICQAKNSGEFVVSIENNPDMPILIAQNACLNETVQLMADGLPVVNWFADAAATQNIGSGNPVYYTSTNTETSTVYAKTIDADNGCESSIANTTITTTMSPVISNSAECSGNNFNMSASGGSGTLTYELLDKTGTSEGADEIGTTNTTGSFALGGSSEALISVTDANGCSDLKNFNLNESQYNCAAVLPLQNIVFTVQKTIHNFAMLQWKSNTLQPNTVYQLQKSNDGTHFTTINTIRDSSNANRFTFTDKTTASGKNYYRLVTKTRNGEQWISPVLLLTINSKLFVQAFPNPVKNFVTFNFSQISASHQIKINNVWGQNIITEIVTGQRNFKLNTSHWPSGTYLAIITDFKTGKQNAIKILKQ